MTAGAGAPLTPDRRLQDGRTQDGRALGDTAQKLIAAAAAEFNEHGFAGTDTNRIARRAGFAPQTFYRWFVDKIEIFIRVYDAWQIEEARALAPLLAEGAPDAEVAAAAVAHHRAYLPFRRSLRQLSLEHPQVRAARAASRLRQIERIRLGQGARALDAAVLAPWLLEMERLSDALAEGEIEDMGLDPEVTRGELAGIIGRIRRGG
ncbi:TetR/AcrR family transcriptional regulator [Caulobacter sp. KR2-114]|uniref:TetR/AcrR family transcriptional regulator n=1 Tax=Caulobacter sp. KR2-114 TaxID=3400912 RepID=UPI003BFE1D86